jgi:hypothetical protein
MKVIISLITTLFLFSCNNPDVNNDKISLSKVNLQNHLNLKSFSNVNISTNTNVDWNNVNQYKVDNNIEIIEININEKNKSKIEFNLFHDRLKYELISVKENEEIDSFLLEAYSYKNSNLFNCNLNKLEKFSGVLVVYDINGNKLGSLTIINGVSKTNDLNKNLLKLNTLINSFSISNKINSKIPACLYTVPYETESWIDYYNVVTTPSGAYLGTYYTHSVLVSSQTSYMEIAYACGVEPEQGVISIHTPSNINHITYNSQTDFINAFNNTTKTGFSQTFDSFQSNALSTVKFSILPWCGITVYINENIGQPFKINDVASDTWGMTLGYTWNQSTFTQNSNGITTTITVYGTISYTLFAQGIGTVYTQPAAFQIIIKNNTGHIVSGTRLP